MKILTVVLGLFSLIAFAEGEAFSEMAQAVKKKTVERMTASAKPIKGTQTGGSCQKAADCIMGKERGATEATCIAKSEGTAANGTVPAGQVCTCLTSIYACGFADK